MRIPLIAALFVPMVLLQAAEPTAEQTEFFEKKIRGVLVERCYKCHSQESEKVKGGLLLDSRAGMLKGGDNGPVIVPGDPDRSLLIKAVRYADEDLQMPPKNKKLPDQEIADLEAWVKMGAPDPRQEKVAASAKPDARKHWAFQPIGQPPIPAVKERGDVRTPIDNFIVAKLEANKLRLAPPADKRTLIRRATFDLTGLPPTFEEVEAFVNDTSPNAFPKVVDRLLASPHYGERWGRYWLDVARYADTKGYVYGREEKRFVHSYAYRDWVVKALNEDMPYDRFLKLQIAADQMPAADRDSLAAMGFLTVGKRFLGVVHDIIDDRIDVLSRGTLGLTVSCARCHDHKFDPIPTADYYSLYGVFANSTERIVELRGQDQNAKDFLEYDTELQRREDTFRTALNQKREEQSIKLRARVNDYLAQVLDVQSLTSEEFYSFLSADDVNPVVVRRWHSYLLQTAKAFNPIWAPWHAFAKIPAKEFSEKAGTVMDSFTDPKSTVNPLVAAAFKNETPSSMREVAQVYGKLLADVNKKWTDEVGKKSSLTKDEEALRQVLYADDSPCIVPSIALADMEWYFDEPTRLQLNLLSQQIERWMVESPGAPPHSVILEDRAEQKNPHIFKRGNPANLGEEVPRRAPAILSGPDRKAFAKGSGRLELANIIASKDNPLTARVMVNRIWQHHFGAGLVRTPSDFGTRCEAPSHPELLDWLARDFMENGWSVKKLHRLIMLSSVYRQSSEPVISEALASALNTNLKPQEAAFSPPADTDPQNKLLSHFPRQRLDFESLRDSMLFASGELDLQMGGKPQELFMAPFSKRRAVYGYLDRQILPGTLRIFDFASPDMHSPQRSETTVPQQALFFMNSQFVVERAKALAAHPAVAAPKSPEQKIGAIYRLVYEREPTPLQVKLGMQYIQSAEEAKSAEPEEKPVPPSWKYGYGEFDEMEKTVKNFKPLPKFVGEKWQGGLAWPDKKLGYMQLTATGGHAGNDLQHAVIRRWVSTVKGAVSIEGTLKHEHDSGHGIRGWLWSSRHGLLGNWVLHNESAETKVDEISVEPGDTIDFIVSINKSLNFNDFIWTPVVRMTGPTAIRDTNGYAKEWDAKRDFAGPPAQKDTPLTAWEKYTQALLSANEFLFVD